MVKNKGNILIIDDDKFILLSLRMFLENHFDKVDTSINPNEIPTLLAKTDYEVVLLDMNFKKGDTSGDDGIHWLRFIKNENPCTSVIIITAYGEIQKAVRAVKAGAIDFISKPWENEKLLPTIINACELSQSQQKIRQLKSRQEIIGSSDFIEIIGESEAIKQLKEQISKVAETDANVLIHGENGTGKEVVAQNIHHKSQRANEAMISVDLGSITETLFESELFGHTKGAFTNAIKDRIGRFEAASGSTLFLDEISNIPMHLQAKLLKAIQERKINRLGSNKEIKIDIRLISASNLNLNQLVTDGKFRQDLLYRINTVEIILPALRERREDIPLLANYFLAVFRKKYRKEKLGFPDYVIKKLQKYQWPGNVRELQHAIERAVIMSDGKSLSANSFNFLGQDNFSEVSKTENFNLEKIEKQAIKQCIDKNSGNLTKAAEELGLTRGALYRRIEKYDL